MPETPRITAILPVHNGARFVEEALESIRGQTVSVHEIIAIDDGSSDDSATRVRSWSEKHDVPVSVLTTEHVGPAAARNVGVKVARSDLLAFLDVDDLWPADKLRIQLGYLTRDPRLDLVIGLVEMQCLLGASPDQQKLQAARDRLTHYHIGSGLYRRRIFNTVGEFNANMTFGEDIDWFLRAREEPTVRGARHNETGLLYRLHGGNMTNDQRGATTGMLHAIKRSADRRRRKGTLSPVADFPLIEPVQEPAS